MTAKLPAHIKPTERMEKRRVASGMETGKYEVIDKRDIHFLDPGTIKITTRLRNELNKS